ncbi:MAG: acyloxyacyl hydrolase [Pseudomonadota bacterium]|nr:acyloxyacyl hydrolase [Pseudomonadota bacterium]
MSRAALFALITLFLGLTTAIEAHAIRSVSIELGAGDDSTRMVRIGARRDWDKRWGAGHGWVASGFWEAGLGYWQGDGAGKQDIWDVSFTPVFRLRSGISPFYLEGAIGAHYLSETRINNRRDFGSNFNFGEHLGFGWNFGGQDRYELGYRFQYISNANLAEPNDGIHLHQFRFGYNY